MNKKILSLCIIIALCIIILITAILLINHPAKNDPSSNLVESSKIEEMENSELADLFYNLSNEDEFVNDKEKDYSFANEGADSVEDAIEKAKTIGQSSNTKMLDLKLQDETDYYYVIYQKYSSNRGDEDIIFENSYLFFKNSVFDIDNGVANLDILNSADKLKKILNLYVYINFIDTDSVKVLLPEISEKPDSYVYTYYFFLTSYGDWGLSDDIELHKGTLSINKENGKISYTEELIRNVSGENKKVY